MCRSAAVLWQGLRGAVCRSGLAVAVRQTGVGVIDWTLRDRRTGRIVVAQWPNTALIVWIAASVVLALSDPDGTWGLALRVVATGGIAAPLTAALDGPRPWSVGASGRSHEAPGRQHGCLPRR
jgi:hypothetical protein